MSKKSRFRWSFDKQHGKWDQNLLKSEFHQFYHIYWSLWRQWSSEKSLLLICKISGLFFNTLTAGQKYSLLKRDNLKPPTQMQLSPKGKTFSQFFSAFLTCRFNFEDFQEKDDPHNWCILEVTDSKNRGQMNV